MSSDYQGNKKLPYTQLYGTARGPKTRDRWAENETIIGGPPKDFIVAITEWIDESLSPMIKQAINFEKQTKQMIYLSTNLDYVTERRRGMIFFHSDSVKIECYGNGFSSSSDRAGCWTVSVEYANPKLFDYITNALKRFYNG